MTSEEVLRSQIDYYRARAPEFDEWYDRSGVYDWGEGWNTKWKAELGEVERAIGAFGIGGNVLEVACGTGIWGQHLARAARRYVGVDASPEALELARGRMPDAELVRADLFEWDTGDRFDLIFMGFWISHVPADRFEWFFGRIASWLADGGRIFFVDNLKRPLPILDEGRFWEREIQPDGVATRNVKDGREYKIVKHYYEPDELEARLRSLGWSVSISHTEWFFYYGGGSHG
jgi:SAM-dependent methyltransferase